MAKYDTKLITICSDNGREIPVNVLKSLYVVSDETVEEICRRYKLPVRVVMKYIQEGKWNELRKENRALGLKTLKDESFELFEDLLDLKQYSLRIKILMMKEKLQDMIAYRVEHGDFKVRKDNGDVMHTVKGMPLYLSDPIDSRFLNEIRNMVEVMDGLVKILKASTLELPDSKGNNEKDIIELSPEEILELANRSEDE